MNSDYLQEVVCQALREDVGRGDVTSELVVEPTRQARGFFLAKANGVLAGLCVAETVWRSLDPAAHFEREAQEGDRFEAGRRLASVTGRARALLTGERVALNFLQRMSGIATMTRALVARVAGTRVRILDTRKTVPLLRPLDRYAVRVGGGYNHRSGLDDGILIKDNHIVIAGGLSAALRTARAKSPHLLRVEVEVKNMAELDEALAENAEVILLDNMTPEAVRLAVERVQGRARLEVSGGITLENIGRYAETGVEYISIGALTHSVKALDISFELEDDRLGSAK